ncbi:hypothetical protein GCM10023187_30240 [Nibrella viscosa]|uniref:Uncharacterized protein n=1 Tax=Nibrella viscosa TaxID=1084524 RepID=A0ABP8KKQ6_9BACT
MTGLITFNTLKHYLPAIKALIAENQLTDSDHLRSALLPLGASQMDIYTGALDIEQIVDEVERWLRANGLSDQPAFAAWLTRQNGYGAVTLSDGSCWVLRLSLPPAFVHLHPGRYSPHTFRAKANQLKTAIAALIISRQQNQPISLPEVNNVRTQILGLSPIKALTDHGEIRKLLSLLTA